MLNLRAMCAGPAAAVAHLQLAQLGLQLLVAKRWIRHCGHLHWNLLGSTKMLMAWDVRLDQQTNCEHRRL
jgi:hypothetical protein